MYTFTITAQRQPMCIIANPSLESPHCTIFVTVYLCSWVLKSTWHNLHCITGYSYSRMSSDKQWWILSEKISSSLDIRWNNASSATDMTMNTDMIWHLVCYWSRFRWKNPSWSVSGCRWRWWSVVFYFTCIYFPRSSWGCALLYRTRSDLIIIYNSMNLWPLINSYTRTRDSSVC